MSQSICTRCISRSYLSIETSATSSPSFNVVQRVAFTTSPSLAANPPKKKGAVAPSTRQGTTLRLNKNKRETSGRPPAPGERKALRKKIVLSNTNALEVQGLQELNKENGTASKLAELEGQVLGLTDANVEALRSLEAFKHTQAWNLFRRPATVIRKDTIEIAKALEAAEGGEDREKAKEVVKRVLFGEKGSGKSVLQLQAMALALNKGWVVIHIPNGQDLTNGHTSYQPDQSGKLYAQPHYTATLLDKIVKANEKVLSTMQISMKHELPMPVQSNISLARFAELGARDPEIAYQIYVALMKELSAPSKPDAGAGQQRVPLLLGFDAFDHAMRLSKYLDAETKPIHAHDLALVNTYARYMTGENPLPNGGVILAAVSESNRAASPTMDYLLDTKHGEKTNWVELRFNPHRGWKAEPMKKWNPYAPFDDLVGKCLEGVEAHKVEGLSKAEAKGLMEYYAMSGVLRGSVTERFVSEKWSLSGGGIIGELESAAVRTRI